MVHCSKALICPIKLPRHQNLVSQCQVNVIPSLCLNQFVKTQQVEPRLFLFWIPSLSWHYLTWYPFPEPTSSGLEKSFDTKISSPTCLISYYSYRCSKLQSVFRQCDGAGLCFNPFTGIPIEMLDGPTGHQTAPT
jgi:hypothetical protein